MFRLLIKQGIYVCLTLHVWRTVQPIYFTLGRFVDEDLRKCSAEFAAIWTNFTFTISRMFEYIGNSTDARGQAIDQARFEQALHSIFFSGTDIKKY